MDVFPLTTKRIERGNQNRLLALEMNKGGPSASNALECWDECIEPRAVFFVGNVGFTRNLNCSGSSRYGFEF